MTGYYTDEPIESAIKNGADEAFEKPLDLESIEKSCSSAVRKKVQ